MSLNTLDPLDPAQAAVAREYFRSFHPEAEVQASWACPRGQGVPFLAWSSEPWGELPPLDPARATLTGPAYLHPEYCRSWGPRSSPRPGRFLFPLELYLGGWRGFLVTSTTPGNIYRSARMINAGSEEAWARVREALASDRARSEDILELVARLGGQTSYPDARYNKGGEHGGMKAPLLDEFLDEASSFLSVEDTLVQGGAGAGPRLFRRVMALRSGAARAEWWRLLLEEQGLPFAPFLLRRGQSYGVRISPSDLFWGGDAIMFFRDLDTGRVCYHCWPAHDGGHFLQGPAGFDLPLFSPCALHGSPAVPRWVFDLVPILREAAL